MWIVRLPKSEEPNKFLIFDFPPKYNFKNDKWESHNPLSPDTPDYGHICTFNLVPSMYPGEKREMVIITKQYFDHLLEKQKVAQLYHSRSD